MLSEESEPVREGTGEGCHLTVTPQAIVAARIHQDRHAEARGKALRIWIADKNCDGFLYGVAFDTQQPGDRVVALGTLNVVVDADCAPYLSGITVDWVEDERGRGFLVTHPEQSRYRGKFFLKDRAQAHGHPEESGCGG